MRPDRKSARDKKAEERFSAMLAVSPKSSVLYDITPDGIYTKDTDTTTRPVLTSRGSLNVNSRISNPNHKVMLAAQNPFDTDIFPVSYVVCM
jgi:hypothetical protein